MKLNIQLTLEDYLEYQLYSSSKSKNQNRNRFISRIIVPIVYLFFCVYYFVEQNNDTSLVFLLVAILWYLIYPLYSRWHYKRHFKKHIEENFKNRINKPVELIIDDSSIIITEQTSQSKTNNTDLKNLIELKNHFFIKLSTDVSLIIPKKFIEDQSNFKELLISNGAEYVNETNWSWK